MSFTSFFLSRPSFTITRQEICFNIWFHVPWEFLAKHSLVLIRSKCKIHNLSNNRPKEWKMYSTQDFHPFISQTRTTKCIGESKRSLFKMIQTQHNIGKRKTWMFDFIAVQIVTPRRRQWVKNHLFIQLVCYTFLNTNTKTIR